MIMQHRNINQNIIKVISLLTALLIMFFISANLRYQYLWYDEAVQFWISKGIQFFQPPLTKPGNIFDVIQNIRHGTMEPGGFSILLHYWTYISNHIIWLRLLPFIFFLGVLLSFYYLVFTKTRNYFLSTFSGLLPTFVSIFLNTAFELRPYSMEMLGAVICVISIEDLKKKCTRNNLLLWSCVLSFFLTSRYSQFITTAATCIIILLLIIKEKETLKQQILKSIILIIPLLITSIFIFFSQLRFQNSGLDKVHYQNYLSDDISLLFKGFNFVYILFIVFITLIYIFFKQKISKLQYAYLTCIIVNWLFILLSFFGIYPWDASSTRCISMLLLSFLIVTLTLVKLLNTFFHNRPFYYSIIFSFMFLFFSLFNRNNFITRFGNNMAINFKKINLANYKRVYVDFWETPYVKYLFEYGSMKNELGQKYPSHFTLHIWPPDKQYTLAQSNQFSTNGYKSLPKMNSFKDYDLLITPYLYNLGDNDKWKKMDGAPEFFIKKE
jgi:hypothetical protein